MRNSTTIRVPQKYRHMIYSIYKDTEGYWVYLENGYYSHIVDKRIFHEKTIKDTLKEIRLIKRNEL
jgi:hypothetical protein